MPWCQFLMNLLQPPHLRWRKKKRPCLSPRTLVSGKAPRKRKESDARISDLTFEKHVYSRE